MVVVRLLLTVVVGVALIAATVPIVQDARTQTAHTAADRSISRMQTVITELTSRSDPTRETPGAGRTLDVSIPDASAGSLGIDWFAVGGVPGRPGPAEPRGTDIISYSVAGSVRIVRLPAVEVRVLINNRKRADNVALVMRGATTLRFTYRIGEVGPVILVQAQTS